MYMKETFVDKAAEGKSKVLEFGVYILETLGSVGLPAEHVTQALLSFRGEKGNENSNENKNSIASKKKKKKSSKRKRRKQKLLLEQQRQRLREEQERQRRQHGDGNTKEGDLLQRALRFVIEARSSSPQQVISRILFYLADALGESLDHPSKRNLERAVGAFVEEAHFQRGSRVKLEHIPQPLSRAVTGVVLSYQERDDLILPTSTLNKIRRGMHFDIPIRPFDATVQLLPPPINRRKKKNNKMLCDQPQQPQEEDTNILLLQDDDVDGQLLLQPQNSFRTKQDDEEEEFDKLYQQELEEQDLMGRMMANNSCFGECVVPCTPQSFPPTPESRTAVLGEYSEFTENVLWRARDELRGEQEDNDRPRMAIFNPDDCHQKVLLSCGGHCAALEPRTSGMLNNNGIDVQQRIYRSVRAALTFQYGRTTYFEMCPVWSGNENRQMKDYPLQLCVGISTKTMPLRNTVSGCSPKTIGLDSSGVLLLAGRRTKTTGFTYGSVIGVCVRSWISHTMVSFYVDGKYVYGDIKDLGIDETVSDKDNEEFKDKIASFTIKNDSGSAPTPSFPTISIKSNYCKVYAHFSAADMRHQETDVNYWKEIRNFTPGDPIYALDGTRLFNRSRNPAPTPASSPSH